MFNIKEFIKTTFSKNTFNTNFLMTFGFVSKFCCHEVVK